MELNYLYTTMKIVEIDSYQKVVSVNEKFFYVKNKKGTIVGELTVAVAVSTVIYKLQTRVKEF